MPIRIVHTGEQISREELLSSHQDPSVLGYIEKLRSAGYSEKTRRSKRTIVAAFLRWARNRQVLYADLDRSHMETFLAGRRPGRNSRWRHARGILLEFLAFLLPDEARPRLLEPSEDAGPAGLLARYQDFLINERGLAKQTVYVYTPLVRTAIAGLTRHSGSLRPCDWNAEAVHSFLLERSHGRSSEGMRLVAVTLRSLLRFLYLRGEMAIDLVPRPVV